MAVNTLWCTNCMDNFFAAVRSSLEWWMEAKNRSIMVPVVNAQGLPVKCLTCSLQHTSNVLAHQLQKQLGIRVTCCSHQVRFLRWAFSTILNSVCHGFSFFLFLEGQGRVSFLRVALILGVGVGKRWRTSSIAGSR